MLSIGESLWKSVFISSAICIHDPNTRNMAFAPAITASVSLSGTFVRSTSQNSFHKCPVRSLWPRK